MPPLRAYWLVLAIVAAVVVGAIAGDWLSDIEAKDRLLEALRGADEGEAAVSHQVADWEPLASNLHDLQTATIRLAPFETHGRGGAIEEIDGNVIFASAVGQLGYLTPALELRRIDLDVPMNAEVLGASPVSQTPGFINFMFRVLDLLVVERSDGEFDLYVSHHRFADGCFEIVVSRVRLSVDGGEIRPASADWDEVFVASPCVPPKTTGMVFEGNESGGRLVLLDPNTMLVSLGDLQFNGVDDPQAFAQDPNVDLGKIIAVDLQTGQARIYSSGHRNPQGLLVARDGTVWETEHGPQGGDEINIIREGADYGWPSVTYGMYYGFGSRRAWPPNPVQGSHDGFEKPAYAFVPSISISNLVQPDPREFPLWRDHLLLGSLYSAADLFLARVEGERIVYTERIELSAIVRDLISLQDGRIAILTDEGELIFLRNADDGEGDGSGDALEVSASDEVLSYIAGRQTTAASGSEFGEEVFGLSCSSCHSLAGVVGAGPPLDGVVGRPIGAVEGYPYSIVLSESGGVWTRRRLVDFLLDPKGQFPGTSMPPLMLPRDSAEAVAAFLDSDGD